MLNLNNLFKTELNLENLIIIVGGLLLMAAYNLFTTQILIFVAGAVVALYIFRNRNKLMNKTKGWFK